MADETCDTCCAYDKTEERNGVGRCRHHECETHWQHRCNDYFPVSFRYPPDRSEVVAANFALLYGIGSKEALVKAIEQRMHSEPCEIPKGFRGGCTDAKTWPLNVGDEEE